MGALNWLEVGGMGKLMNVSEMENRMGGSRGSSAEVGDC